MQLRELEAASLALERDEENTAAAGNDWLRMLIAPGGSLGGPRPKASVVDPQGHLWIAKFPSVRDEHDVGAWELVVQTLVRDCGLRVPDSLGRRFANPHHSFLVKRFEGTAQGRRLHLASAMTLTGHQDGDDASTGGSYLEIARPDRSRRAAKSGSAGAVGTHRVQHYSSPTPTITCATMAFFWCLAKAGVCPMPMT